MCLEISMHIIEELGSGKATHSCIVWKRRRIWGCFKVLIWSNSIKVLVLEQIILVGHSMGGTTIARATERYPHKIHVAVYVSGSMYTSGMSGTEINGEVYNLDFFFWHYYFLKPPFVISFMEWLDTHYMVMSKFTSILRTLYILIERTTLHQMWHMWHLNLRWPHFNWDATLKWADQLHQIV